MHKSLPVREKPKRKRLIAINTVNVDEDIQNTKSKYRESLPKQSEKKSSKKLLLSIQTKIKKEVQGKSRKLTNSATIDLHGQSPLLGSGLKRRMTKYSLDGRKQNRVSFNEKSKLKRAATQLIIPLQAINEKSTETEEDLKKKVKTSKFVFGKKE